MIHYIKAKTKDEAIMIMEDIKFQHNDEFVKLIYSSKDNVMTLQLTNGIIYQWRKE
jgi:ribulose bisphosphate carboxylase small subunit